MSKRFYGVQELSEMDDATLDALADSGEISAPELCEAKMLRHLNQPEVREVHDRALNAMLEDRPHDHLQMQRHAKSEPLALNELQQFVDTSDEALESLVDGGELTVPDLAAIRLMKTQRRDADYNDAAILALGERYRDHGSASERAPEGYADRIMRLAQESGHFEQ